MANDVTPVGSQGVEGVWINGLQGHRKAGEYHHKVHNAKYHKDMVEDIGHWPVNSCEISI